MSHGPGAVERVITDLLASLRYSQRTLTVEDLCAKVFRTRKTTRAQRGSVLRAAHRALKRSRENTRLRLDLDREARKATEERFGWRPRRGTKAYKQSDAFYFAHPAYLKRLKVPYGQLDGITATTRADRVVVFHHHYFPVRVWAYAYAGKEPVFTEAEIVDVDAKRVRIRHQGKVWWIARSGLARGYVHSRGLWFTSNREYAPNKEPFRRFSWRALFREVLMPMEPARKMLGVSAGCTRAEVVSAFRREAFRHHPDYGGQAEQFRELVKARDRLLSALPA